MDYREEQFKKIFADVARQFGIHPHEVVSLRGLPKRGKSWE